MLRIVKTINLVNRRMALWGRLLIAAALALVPIPAGAQCKSWEASREMTIIQPGFQSWLWVEQNGSVITGTAAGTVQQEDRRFRTPTVSGTVDGTFDGNTFSIQIYWKNDQTGVYTGKVLPSGRLDGEGYEKRSPNVRVPWHSEGVLKCAPPPPAPKPLKSSGKVRTSEPAPPKPPFITAGAPIIIQPIAPFASVYLGWDGGPDHPNVEVWLSIDNGIESPAFSITFAQQSPLWKQPKGGGEMKLQRNHHYKFVLKGAGKTLSTVDFVVP